VDTTLRYRPWKFMPYQKLVLAILLFSSLAWAQDGANRPDLRLLFTGDIMLSRQVQIQYETRKLTPWANLKALFSQADWVGGNLEGAIGDASQCLSKTNCFATPSSATRMLKDAGFHALTLENNHSGDVGADGRQETRSSLQNDGLMALDFESSPQFLRLRDTTIGIVALTTVRAADDRVQSIPSIEVAQKLRTARSLSNFVIVSIHWGSELVDWSNDAQRQQAEWLVDHGADLVVGHHPHVVQPPACVHGKPVFFSLGNHVFDQKYLDTKEGMIAECRIHDKRLTCDGIRTHTEPGSYVPELAGPDPASSATLAGCTATESPALEISGYQIRPEPWFLGQPDDGIVVTGWKDGSLKWRTRRQRLLSLETGKLSGGTGETFLFSLERHPSSLDQEKAVRPYVYAVGPHGPIARWRGSALAWPLLDATVDSESGTICALHRGDSFLSLDKKSTTTRTAVYQWTGFGFRGVEDPMLAQHCARVLGK
jgi:hypothetical protein